MYAKQTALEHSVTYCNISEYNIAISFKKMLDFLNLDFHCLDQGAPNSAYGIDPVLPFSFPWMTHADRSTREQSDSHTYSSQVLLQPASWLCRPSRLSASYSGQVRQAVATLGNCRSIFDHLFLRSIVGESVVYF